jgi:hypothetical protein
MRDIPIFIAKFSIYVLGLSKEVYNVLLAQKIAAFQSSKCLKNPLFYFKSKLDLF